MDVGWKTAQQQSKYKLDLHEQLIVCSCCSAVSFMMAAQDL